MAILEKHLRRIAELPSVGDVRRRGMMVGIELVADRATQRPFPASAAMGQQVCRLARERGALLRPLGDVIVVMPPLAITEETLEELGAIVYDSIREARG